LATVTDLHSFCVAFSAWLKSTIETKRKNGKLLAIDHWPRVTNFFWFTSN